jgi:hypothetical protein
MSKDSPAPPAAPDYTGAAVAQGQANIEAARTSARLSNPNIVGPYGTQQISYEGDQPTVTQTLNPNAQAALESQQATQKALADLGLQGTTTAQNVMGQAFSPTGGPLQTSLSAPGAVQSSYDMSGLARMPVNAGTTGQEAIMARLQPALAQQRSMKETQLRNQGLVAGGEAYDADMRNLGYQENDARSQAVLQGIGLDTAARSQGFGELQQQANLANTAQAQVQNQGLQSAQFGNAAQQAELQRQLALRQQPLNEITGLMSGSQIQLPQFQQYTGQNVAPAPTFAATQAQGQNAMTQYGIQQSAANAETAGLYGLGGSALGAGGLAYGLKTSDRRLKREIKRIGEHALGIGVYSYKYIWDNIPQVGVMADEVELVRPEAVITGADGFKMVDYGAL